MIKNVVFCSFLLLLSVAVNSQTFKLQGLVTDTTESGLELATAILLNKSDSVMAGFSITNPKGQFRIEDLKVGEYILNITYLGFGDINRTISVERDTDLGQLIMRPQASNLSSVTISDSHIPIQMKNDTIQYNAAAYKVRPADNVEELLKKLPGIEIEDDGTIKAHGEEVQNVFVEGKEFFGNDPTVATKNLPADVIDNVQVYDKQSDMAEFSGIDDGERQKTINLVLKEGKKAGYFGTASAGYGNDERYEGKFNINRFTKSTQLSAIGMVNNTNKQGFSFREYIDFMGGIGNLMSGGRGRGSSNSGLPIANGLGTGFVETGAGGINYNIEPKKDFQINSSYFFNRIENDIRQTTNRQNLLEDFGFDTEQEATLINLNKNHTINSNVKLKIDSTQNLIARVKLGWNDGSSASMSNTKNFNEAGFLQSGGIYDNTSSADKLNGSLNMTYLKRLKKKGRFLSLNTNLSMSDNDQSADLNSINSFNQSGGLTTDTLIQEQIQQNVQKSYLLKLSLTEPLGNRKYLEFNVSRQNFNTDFNKDFYDILDRSGRQPILNDLLSNQYVRDYSYNRAGINLKFNRNNSSLTAGLSLQHSDLNGTLENEQVEISQDYFYLLPSLFWNFDLSSSRSFRIRYSTNTNEPSLEQLQPIVDNSDPLNIYIGNPDLIPSYRHSLNINYNSYSQFSSVGFFSSLNARYTKNNITNTRTVDEFFVQTTSPVNTDYAFNSSLYANFNAPLKFIKQRLNLSTSASFSDNILFVNDLENKVKRLNNNLTLAIDNWNKDVVGLELGTRIGWNTTAYSVSKDQNQSYLDYQYYADLDIDFADDWTISSYFRHTIYSDEDFGEQLSISRWEASISKVFGTAKKFRAELAVFDIFDQNQNVDRTTSLNYIEESRIQSIGRYFLLSVSYSFSGFGQEGWFGGGRRGRGRR